MPLFRTDPSRIFADRRALDPSFIPSRLPHREEEVERLVLDLSPAARGERPTNVLIYGKTGTGKTAVTRFVGRALNEESGGRAKYVHVNCEISYTPFLVLTKILSELRGGQPEAYTGFSQDYVYGKILSAVSASGVSLVVALDEMDRLMARGGEGLLYLLLDANERLDSGSIGVIGIANDIGITRGLDPRVRSRLSEDKIVFPPYTTTQLMDILRDRARVALRPGTWDDGVLELIALTAAAEHGDARRAIELLRLAGDIADSRGSDRITEEHVVEARRRAEEDYLRRLVETLPLHQKAVLMAICELLNRGAPMITMSVLYGAYSNIVSFAGLQPLTQRRVRDFVHDLATMGLISAEVRSFGREGRTTVVTAKSDPAKLRQILLQDELLGSLGGGGFGGQRTLL
ncbi:MAG: cell division control protein Cdc6 [Thermoplasmata archaeon]|nr:MAG: cell division control protein Cdc6 [Thermoplasmata archaeon]